MNIIAIFEAEDDIHLVGHIGLRVGIKLEKPPIPLKGNDGKRLRRTINEQSKADHDRLVLVLDADHEPEGGPAKRWKEVLAVLRETGFSVPEDISTDHGLVYDLEDKRRVAVWIFPDCKSPGAIEEFMMQVLIPTADPLLQDAQDVVRTLRERRFPPKYDRKAEVRTWLSWQKRPGLPPGQALAENVFVFDEQRLGPFIAWLRLAFT